jgi:pyruvate kinase
MSKKILCTLGPASMNEHVISRLEDLGVDLFRINLSHTRLENLPEIISYVQDKTRVPLCLDTEGAQVRNGSIKNGSVVMREHSIVKIVGETMTGDETQFSLYPEYVIEQLQIGDFVSIDFDSVLLQVVKLESKIATMRVLNGGNMGQNKAVTINRPIRMPPLTDKDQKAIEIGRNMGITNFALSFANYSKDVDFIRSLTGKDAFIISKIECRNGVNNLKEITEKSDAILIDRGDLSREFPIERIPSLQKRIIDHCKSSNVDVYVATNLLETMIQSPTPTRAEVNDVYTTLSSGADGLVLAAETAIGSNPIACASMIVKLIHSFEVDQLTQVDGFYHDDPKSLLVEPHGGHLVHRVANEEDIREADSLRKIRVEVTDLMDCEQIANGTYSPITGFMNQETLTSVLEANRLPDGLVWTMPILLQITDQDISLIERGDCIALTDKHDTIYATLDVSEVFKIDMVSVAKKWFGTASKKHPGVARFLARGENCIAGAITLIRELTSMYRHFQLSPVQTRILFSHKGWSRVVGFHTRNPAHRIHEYLQLTSLTNVHADGLYISPVIGPKKIGDFQPEMIMRSYEVLINNGIYPEGKVVLGGFSTYSRYSGPREAIFTMLCRKNMGCSHFIIGRDHTGVDNFYSANANYDYLEQLGDIGIKPILFDEIGYSPVSKGFVEVKDKKEIIKISGTKVREALREGKELPEWFMRSPVQDLLLNSIKQGVDVFH